MNGGRLAKAGLVSLVGGGAGAVLGLVLAVVVGRGLGDTGTGYFFQLVALFMILANVLELGADTGLVRELSRQVALGRFADLRRTVVVAVVPVVLVGTVALGAVWLAAPWLAELLTDPAGRPVLTELIRQTVPLALLASLVAVLLGGTRGLGGVLPFTAVHNIGLPVARVAGVLVVLGAGYGVVVAAHAWAWPFAVAAAVAAVILLRQLRERTGADAARPSEAPAPTQVLAREFWTFSAPRGVAAALEIALVWIDVLIVGAVLGPTAAGVYAVVSRCAQSGLLVENAMRMAVSPRISGAMATGDLATARSLHLATTRAMILLAWPFYLTLALFAPLVLGLFGDGFGEGTVPLALLCVAMLIWTGAGMVQTILLMGGRSSWQMKNKAVALATNVIGNLVLVPVCGIAGAALAWALTIAVDAGLAIWQVHRVLTVRIASRDLLAPVAVVLGAVGVPGVLLRWTLGPTPAALGLHVLCAAALLAAVCWRMRESLGLASAAGMFKRGKAKVSAGSPAP